MLQIAWQEENISASIEKIRQARKEGVVAISNEEMRNLESEAALDFQHHYVRSYELHEILGSERAFTLQEYEDAPVA